MSIPILRGDIAREYPPLTMFEPEISARNDHSCSQNRQGRHSGQHGRHADWGFPVLATSLGAANPKSENFPLNVEPEVHDLSILNGVGLALESQGALLAACGEGTGLEQ